VYAREPTSIPNPAPNVQMTDPKDDILRYQELLGRDPRSRVFAPLAEACRKAGLLDQALAIAREGVAHHPNYAGGRVALGRVLMALGRFTEAEAELARAVRAAPGGALGFRLLGEARARMGDRDGAFEAFARALALNPDDEDARRGVMELDAIILGFRGAAAAAALEARDEELDLPLEAMDGDEDAPEAFREEVYWELPDASDDAAPREMAEPPELDLELVPDLEPVLEWELEPERASGGALEDAAERELVLELLDISQSSLAPEADEDGAAWSGEEAIGGTEGGTEPAPEEARAEAHPDLRTETLADLYVQQGHLDRAREVYRAIIAENPLHLRAKKKLHAITRPPEAPPPGSRAGRIAVLDRWLANIRRRGARREGSGRAARVRLPGDPNQGA
jgi:tetratricopeptide (TPR) repeat protein